MQTCSKLGRPVHIPDQMRTHKSREDRVILDSAQRPEPGTAILVVDDDPRNLLAVEAALEGLSEVVRAGSGAEALRSLLTRDFALVLLDVQMPGIDGFETAALIRRRMRSRHTPIIFITAYNRDDREVLRAYDLGAVDFLFKPVVPEMLRAKASVFVELERERNQVARQAELLRAHERREHARALIDERRRWEEQALRRQMEEERQASLELARKTEQLTRLVEERELAQRELARMNEELASTNARKDQFIAVLSHELRNPLAPLVHGLELLRLHLDAYRPCSLEPMRRIQATMTRQAATLRRLVDDLLDISRIDRGQIELQKELFSIDEVIQQAVSTVQPSTEERRQTLTLDLPAETLCIEGDPVRIAQLLGNILTNASRYTGRDGNIEVRCRREASGVRIAIRDDGRGIAPELLPRIFDMFVQERRGGEGLGLGLTLARMLVEQHGGTIEAHSDGVDRGSTFTVWLPCAESSPRKVGSGHRLDRPHRACQRSYRVAVVDDQADVRESLGELLVHWGHTVYLAADGEEALEVIRRERPTIAFLDIGMPERDGYAVAKQLRQEVPRDQLRLIALTGFGQPSDLERARSAGFDGHLVKPTSPEALESVFLDLQATEQHRP